MMLWLCYGGLHGWEDWTGHLGYTHGFVCRREGRDWSKLHATGSWVENRNWAYADLMMDMGITFGFGVTDIFEGIWSLA